MRPLYVLLLVSSLLWSCIPSHPRTGMQVSTKPGTVLQEPVDRVKDGSIEKIIEYEGFTVSYNSQLRIPMWVSYELTAEETTGPFSRDGKDYQPDPYAQVTQADASDYRRSGWTRGHLAPAADFRWSDIAMTQSFYYTNICPQDGQLNNRYWATLEKHVRGWAKQFGKVLVVTGPVLGNNVRKIGTHGVAVPEAFFKVILAQNGEGWTSIGFVMMNTPDPRFLKDCAMTVNAVEKLTGLDFFDFLDNGIEEKVENTLDYKTWRVY